MASCCMPLPHLWKNMFSEFVTVHYVQIHDFLGIYRKGWITVHMATRRNPVLARDKQSKTCSHTLNKEKWFSHQNSSQLGNSFHSWFILDKTNIGSRCWLCAWQSYQNLSLASRGTWGHWGCSQPRRTYWRCPRRWTNCWPWTQSRWSSYPRRRACSSNMWSTRSPARQGIP